MNPVTFRLFRQEVRGHSTFNDSLPHTIDPILQRLRLDRHGWCDLVSESYTEVARMLIEAGLDVSVHYPKVGTAFDFANIMGREEIAKLIASKTTVDPEGRGHNTVTPDPLWHRDRHAVSRLSRPLSTSKGAEYFKTWTRRRWSKISENFAKMPKMERPRTSCWISNRQWRNLVTEKP